jgi:hypothetical protein
LPSAAWAIPLIRDVQVLMRHSSVDTTAIYVHTDLTYCGARSLSSNRALSGSSEILTSQINRKMIRGFVVRLHDGGNKRVAKPSF